MNKIYMGIDPSYTKTGVSYIDLEDKFILFQALTPEGKNDLYVNMIHRARMIADEMFEKVENENITLIIEEPLIISQKASSLGILSGVLASEIINNLDVEAVYTLNPNAVANTNRGLKNYSSKTRKKVSKEMALKYIEVFEKHGYTIVVYNKINNKDGSMRKRELSTDEAESFIMAIILMRHIEVLDEELVKELVALNRGLNASSAISKLK